MNFRPPHLRLPAFSQAPILSNVPQEVSFETGWSEVGENEMLLNLGPQHPSTHGVLRIILKMDGEVVTGAIPDVGFLHRGVEKLAENRTYPQFIILTDRNDYLSAMTNNWAFCLTVEKILKVQIPERAEYLRVIVGELNRVASHLVFLGTFGIDIGAYTPFLQAFGKDREMILDLFEEICGARITYNYIRIGGVMADAPEGWMDKVLQFIEYMGPRIKDYDDLLTYNPIFMDRTKKVGILTREKAISYGVSGPNLRASGVSYDLRRAEPYGVYSKFDFEIPVGLQGDCWDRYFVRRREMVESLKIVRQAVEGIQPGQILGKVPKANLRPPKGEAYSHLEGSRGVLGSYVIADGTDKPYRVHIRAPSFLNLATLQEILVGWKIADVVAILGSIDIVLGEVDR